MALADGVEVLDVVHPHVGVRQRRALAREAAAAVAAQQLLARGVDAAGAHDGGVDAVVLLGALW